MTKYNNKHISKRVKTASYDYKNNSDKDKFNNLCSNAMLQKKAKTALILDGIHMRTTKACESIGIKKSNITSIERNRRIHNLHNKNGINTFLGDVWNNVISKYNYYRPYDALILDAVSSCKTVSENIENIFANNYLSKKSVLALTVTKRSNIKYAIAEKDYEEIKQLIQYYASKYNYKSKIYAEHDQSKVKSIIFHVDYY